MGLGNVGRKTTLLSDARESDWLELWYGGTRSNSRSRITDSKGVILFKFLYMLPNSFS